MDPDDPLLSGPIYMRPHAQCNGVRPATQMLNSDLLLHRKFTPEKWTPGAPFAPAGSPAMALSETAVTEADIAALQAYLQSVDTNLVVPDPAPSEDPAEDPAAEEPPAEPFWNETSLDGPSRSSEDGGTSIEHRRGVREYLKSGYTRSNPDGTYEEDNDFGGKWAEEVTIVEGSAEHGFFDVAVADGDFGDEDSFFSGEGRVLGSDASTSAGFELTNEALKGSAELQINGSLIEGSIETADDGLVSGGAEGAAMSGDATAKAEVILSPEQATLKGELGLEVNVLEGAIDGDIHITPRRAINPAINLWNWATNDDVGELGENWDIGIVVGGEVSGQIGAQAGVEGEVGYEDGRATAEAGAKIGLGVGVGVKARGGLVGVDKVIAGAKSAWGGIKNAWNSEWF